MDDPVSRGFLPDSFLHESLLGAEQFHRQLVVGGLEEGLQLVLEETLLAGLRGAQGGGPGLLLRGAVERDIVDPEVHLATAFVVHVVGEEVRDEQRLVIECGYQGVGARVGVLDADLDGVILGQAARRRRPNLFLGLSRGHPSVR